MNDECSGGNEKVVARRRLIRGAFVAPAALTLCSGSVFAASSSSQCLTTAVENGTQATGEITDTAWLSVPSYRLDDGSLWISGNDLPQAPMPPAALPYLSDTEWQCVQAGTTHTVGQRVDTMKPDTIPDKWTVPQQSGNARFALRVDADGTVLGVQAQGLQSAGAAASMVCWASFVGRA